MPQMSSHCRPSGAQGSKSSRTSNNHVEHKPLKRTELFITLDNEIGRASEHLLYHTEVSCLSHEQKL